MSYLGYPEVAALAGVSEATLRRYLSLGHMPDPDVRLGQSPGWELDTIRRWLAARPGRGNRAKPQEEPTRSLHGPVKRVAAATYAEADDDGDYGVDLIEHDADIDPETGRVVCMEPISWSWMPAPSIPRTGWTTATADSLLRDLGYRRTDAWVWVSNLGDAGQGWTAAVEEAG